MVDIDIPIAWAARCAAAWSGPKMPVDLGECVNGRMGSNDIATTPDWRPDRPGRTSPIGAGSKDEDSDVRRMACGAQRGSVTHSESVGRWDEE
jgi:hypothetical protein